ncbi:hypothetical protein PHABIO_90 [Pseudomonas phage Phabio]|uniref:Uncharacterized protein n=1 Tax=Pseudomonas phage Phabio TaxID=2006668 RepID=A0A1Y0STB6_9CAUD|nr:hypothetical protein MZD05_gp090 [Pseudomonas phage Phabio]ARV76721.1 hypothetical protein PHABIO_90 [Pseudomonas phage Phabio]
MRLDFYNHGTARIHSEYTDLRLQPNFPHFTELGGDAKITVDTNKRRVVFKQSGHEHEYNNVDFVVNRALEGYEFEFKRPSLGGCVLEVSFNFALQGIIAIYFTTPETVSRETAETIHANGYKY